MKIRGAFGVNRASSWALRAAAGDATLEVARRPQKGRKSLEVKGWVTATENQSAEEGKNLSKTPSRNVARCQAYRCPCKVSALQLGWEPAHVGLHLAEVSLSCKEQLPSFLPPRPPEVPVCCAWRRPQGPPHGGREKGDHVGTCLFLSVAASLSYPEGRKAHS